MSEWEMTHDDGRTQTVGIGTLPGRKSPALFVVELGMITPLAYFRSVEDADRADELLKTLAHGAVSSE